jgi:hypothetical protein
MILVFLTLVATYRALLYILCSIITLGTPMAAWAQGNSVIRNKKPPTETPASTGWGGGISFNSEETLDEFERPYWGVGANIAYSPWETTILDARLGFHSPYASEDADPRLSQGIDDVGFDWMQSKIWTSETLGSIGTRVSLELPTSELSQRQSKIFASSYGISLGTPLTSWLKLSTGLGASVSAFGYDYADEEGSSFNSPYGFSQSIGLGINFGWGVSWANAYGTGQRYDYGGRWTPTQRYTSSLALQTPVGVSFSATYQWADRVFTNDPIFTDRKSSLTGEMSYEF